MQCANSNYYFPKLRTFADTQSSGFVYRQATMYLYTIACSHKRIISVSVVILM